MAAVWTPTNTTIYDERRGHFHRQNACGRRLGQGRICLGDDINDGHAINGVMQEAAMFTNALSAAQIQGLYAAAEVLPRS